MGKPFSLQTLLPYTECNSGAWSWNVLAASSHGIQQTLLPGSQGRILWVFLPRFRTRYSLVISVLPSDSITPQMKASCASGGTFLFSLTPTFEASGKPMKMSWQVGTNFVSGIFFSYQGSSHSTFASSWTAHLLSDFLHLWWFPPPKRRAAVHCKGYCVLKFNLLG
jgi:hypothetical protein